MVVGYECEVKGNKTWLFMKKKINKRCTFVTNPL